MKFLSSIVLILTLGFNQSLSANPLNLKNLHTFISIGLPGQSKHLYKVELKPHHRDGTSEPDWTFIFSELFPEKELVRVSVNRTVTSSKEVFEQYSASGDRIHIEIDTSKSFAIAPLNFKTKTDISWAGLPVITAATPAMAHRLNPLRPEKNDIGVFGRLGSGCGGVLN